MKYAPANKYGMKPWVVETSEWGRKSESLQWAESRYQAEYQAKGRTRYVTAKGRRATPEDVERLQSRSRGQFE